MTNCELNHIFLGEIATIQNYGAFVKIPGCKQQGLIHKSQVSNSRIDNVADVLQRGEQVWCKIISVDDDGKIGLSMKVVNQGNGTDLDPNGIEMQRDEQKRKTYGTTQKKIIELQAVLNTTCTKCGTKGHLAKECFATPDGKKYELLPDIEDDTAVVTMSPSLPPPPPPPPPGSQSKVNKDEKKSKKSKKRKKSKKSKHKSESNSDDSSSEEDRKRKKKKKKHSKESKRKKRKHSESSTDESSDSITKEKHSKKCKHSKSKHSD